MRTPKIAKLILNSENFESFTIPVKAIIDLKIGGITTTIAVDDAGQLTRSQDCRDLVLRVDLAYLHQLPTDAFDDEGCQLMLDDRLALMPDLVDVDLVDTAGETTTVRLPWRDGDVDDINAAIRVQVSPDRGQLEMIIE